MNVLIFVIVYLMILATLAYGRIESYLSFVLTQQAFERQVELEVPQYYSDIAYHKYQHSHVPSGKNGKDQTEKNGASPMISFLPLLAPKDKEEALVLLTKELIRYLYQEQPFFKEAESERPDLVEDLIQAIKSAAKEKWKNQKWSETKELANVDLGDPLLNQVFTKMLKGTVNKVTFPKKNLNERFLPLSGFFSLQDFITVKENPKIRLWLASPQVLMVLFGDASLVRDLIKQRQVIFHDLINKQYESNQQATEIFKKQFQGRQLKLFPDDLLDFGVSKKNPAEYL